MERLEHMKREDFLKDILKVYSLVSVLRDLDDYKVLHLRHKELGRDIILRSFSSPVSAYEKLLGIKNENLPQIYDVINLSDGQMVLEEFISGLTVAEVMETGRYRKRGVRRVLAAVLSGLSVLHERGIIHRDIKPENIIISDSGRVVLIDFNAARILKPASKDTVIMGTVGYASPELGIAGSDERSDIYAMGILMNVMLTGVHPSEKIARGEFGKIIRKCTAINPGERYESIEKLLMQL